MQQLTTVQSQVLAGLLAGHPIAQVARDHGIHRSTIYNWRHEHPHFTFALDQARSRLQTALYDDVQDLTSQALEVLSELLHSEEASVRLRVAQTILRIGNPMKINAEQRTNIGIETLDDHLTSRQAIRALAADAPPSESEEVDTIRHFSTVESSPTRNQRCPCNSGLKYKRCCGSPTRQAAAS